jgi:hypothetical protein
MWTEMLKSTAKTFFGLYNTTLNSSDIDGRNYVSWNLMGDLYWEHTHRRGTVTVKSEGHNFCLCVSVIFMPFLSFFCFENPY